MFDFIVFLVKTKVKLYLVIVVFLFLASIAWRVLLASISEESITFLDVGQGDAAFIQLMTGEQIVIDVGPGIEMLYQLGNLMPPLDNTIEAIFISHLHADHIGGLDYITSRYEIGELYINICSNGDNVKDFSNYTNDISTFLQNDVYFGEDLTIKSLWPGSTMCAQVGTDENYLSQILEIHLGETTFLFTGDAEFGEEAQIEYNFDLPDSDIIKIPHHGSKHAITTDFLSRTSPSGAIVSVGDNSFGHPAKDIIEILQHSNIPYYRTDKVGNITVHVNNNGYTIEVGD